MNKSTHYGICFSHSPDRLILHIEKRSQDFEFPSFLNVAKFNNHGSLKLIKTGSDKMDAFQTTVLLDMVANIAELVRDLDYVILSLEKHKEGYVIDAYDQYARVSVHRATQRLIIACVDSFVIYFYGARTYL